MPAGVNLNLNQTAINEMLRSATGLVAQYMIRKAEQVKALAQQLLSQMSDSQSGELGRSLVVQPVPTPEGLYTQVVAEAPYARFVEEGTRPHLIFPRQRKALRFDMGGVTVFAAYVNHPGTQPRPFLSRALELSV